ncbi:MAG: glycoside hydrolase family 5 protein, partial [Pseudomonadota bacterium]
MTTTRRQFTCALAGGLSVAAAGCSVAQQTASVRAIDVHGQLSTKDGKVVDQNGVALSLAGPSLFWHNLGWSDRGGLEPGDYYNPAVVRSALRLWNAPIIRAAIGVETNGGYIQHPDYAWSRLTAVVDAAIDNGMYCIVDWHTHHAEDHAPVAHAFFTRVAKRYAGYPNVIYELYNEPLPTANWSRVIRPYAADLMETIRAIDADNLIVVGTRSWSQDVDEAAKEPL